MTVPASLAALSTTAASNPPAGTDAVFPELDDHIRFTYSGLAQLRDQKAPLASPTFTGVVTSPQFSIDATGMWALSGGNPVFTFDTNDSFSYDRTSNLFRFRIASTEKMTITSAGGPERPDDASTANGMVRKSQMDLHTLKSANLSDVASPATALSNLGGIGTSSFTGANQSIAANGFQKLPGGLILQWGGVRPGDVSGSDAASISFPTPFPNACLRVVVSAYAEPPSVAQFVASVYGAPSASGFSYARAEFNGNITAGAGIDWFAIGY